MAGQGHMQRAKCHRDEWWEIHEDNQRTPWKTFLDGFKYKNHGIVGTSWHDAHQEMWLQESFDVAIMYNIEIGLNGSEIGFYV